MLVQLRRLMPPAETDFFAVGTGGSIQYNKPKLQVLGRAFVQQVAEKPTIIRH
jgi:hypothetical protein